jgi:hypothetical protein
MMVYEISTKENKDMVEWLPEGKHTKQSRGRVDAHKRYVLIGIHKCE